MKVGDKVKVIAGIAFFLNRKGVIIAVAKEGKYKDYIVQFKNPVEWSHFSNKEIKRI